MAVERKMPLFAAEQEVFGATHAGVGAYLFGLWGLPSSIVEAVAFHHAPAANGLRAFSPLTAVHVANALEHALAQPEDAEQPLELDAEYLATLGLEHRLDTWRTEAMRLTMRLEEED